MQKKLLTFAIFLLLSGSFSWAADSASNRKDQTMRLGMKSGIHLMYAITNPFVIEMPGENWTLGLVKGDGVYSYSDTNTSTFETTTVNVNFDTTEVAGRYYVGNSFNIPFGYAQYKISWEDYAIGSSTYDIDYSVTQLNIGIGNEWTFDWGGYLGVDWFQAGNKLSDEATITFKSGTNSAANTLSATETSTSLNAFSGALIVNFGFGF